ncbi:uncharacterized protein [Littorina saxatilis]|uniref:uncharacterized protein isoform X2 n=1 Tax=Littorina saxatilis TaxID=31220 RepID=UPI0038B692EF
MNIPAYLFLLHLMSADLIYIIAGSAGGVLVIVTALTIVTYRWRLARKSKGHIQGNKSVAQNGRFDLKSAEEQDPIPVKLILKIGEDPKPNEETNVNLSLEAQPDDDKDGEDLFPVYIHGHTLHLGENSSGNDGVSGPVTASHDDDSGRQSNHHYSDIKDIDELLQVFPGQIPEQSKRRQPGQKTEGATSYGHYEIVDFDTDEDSALGSTLKLKIQEHRGSLPDPSSQKPSSTWQASVQTVCGEEGQDDMFMVDNVAYVSADKVTKNTTGTDATVHTEDTDEDEVMVDNVIYQSSGPRQATEEHRVKSGNFRDNDTVAGSEMVTDELEDEFVMIDNLIYESTL